jgi:hypothetical protein
VHCWLCSVAMGQCCASWLAVAALCLSAAAFAQCWLLHVDMECSTDGWAGLTACPLLSGRSLPWTVCAAPDAARCGFFCNSHVQCAVSAAHSVDTGNTIRGFVCDVQEMISREQVQREAQWSRS